MLGEPGETVLVLDEPAEAAIAGAAAFFRARGLQLTVQTPLSVAFAAPAAGPAAGAGQLAAVPVQLKPEWCRLWITVTGQGPAAAAAGAFIAHHQERAARAAAAVQALEAGIYGEARWPAYAATMRATLERQGLDAVTIEERLARFKTRWDALGRKVARSGEAL